MIGRDPRPGLHALAFAFAAASVLAAQIILSRLFSATIGYDYAFMLVSLAMLGLGAGGLIVQRSPEFFRAERIGVQASVLATMMAVSAVAGVITMVRLYPRLADGEGFWVLGGLFWCFFPFFLSAGLLVAIVLGHAGERFHFYYAVDLTAAAAGCVAAVAILSVKSPVDAMLQGIAVTAMAAASLFALAHRHRRLALASLVATLGLVVVCQALLPYGRFSDPLHLQFLRRATVFSEWNSFSHVTVYSGQFFTWALSPRYQGPPHPMLDLLIDGMGGTEIVKFSGRPEELAKYDYLAHDLTALGHALVPKTANRRQLIIGPGGGVDILQSYREGWRDITVVEINPLVVRAVNDPDHGVGAFSGQPYRLPGVRLFVENARTFVKRSNEAWDLISLTWVDAGGSATAMAYSENYLYTVEAFQEYLARLEPNGMLAFLRSLGVIPGEIKIDSMRGIAVAAEALRRVGIAHPERQVLVAAAESPFWPRPMCYVLVKNAPFTAEETAAAREFLTRLAFSPLWLPDGSLELAAVPQRMRDLVVMIRELLTTSDPESLYQRSTLDLQPSTDDNPFYFMERPGPNRPAGASLLRLGGVPDDPVGSGDSLLGPATDTPPRRAASPARPVGIGGAGLFLLARRRFHVGGDRDVPGLRAAPRQSDLRSQRGAGQLAGIQRARKLELPFPRLRRRRW